MDTIEWTKHITCADAIKYAEQVKAQTKPTKAILARAERILEARTKLETTPDVRYTLRRSHWNALHFKSKAVILDSLRMLEPRESSIAKSTEPATIRIRAILDRMGFRHCSVDDKIFLLRKSA
jgi:hypothetical protein